MLAALTTDWQPSASLHEATGFPRASIPVILGRLRERGLVERRGAGTIRDGYEWRLRTDPASVKPRPRLTLRQLELLLEVLHASYAVVVRAGNLDAAVLKAHGLVDVEETHPGSGRVRVRRNYDGAAHVLGFAKGH